MKKGLASIALAVGLLLSACGQGGAPDPAQTAAIIAQVRSITATACAFVPTATTVAEILSAGNPAVQTAGAIANAICSAVASQPASARRAIRRGARVIVEPNTGVVIHGTFVR